MNVEDSNARRFHVGSTIAGRYRVERPIGEGAMGAVALARHVSLDETVAIKFLPPELRRDPAANARLSREAKALARIKSDHVARVLDVGTTLSVGPYMVMEYLEGTDLGDLLETEGPLPVARAVECVLQVCEALTVAHTAGITHRDIKPQNLFLARHGQFETLKILDFGIAEDAAPPSSVRPAEASEDAVVAGSASLPAEGSAPPPVYGTPSYMAPERVRNDPDADHRSDIWSVGVVLHELVTGRAVFDASSIAETCASIVSDEPIALEANDAILPARLRNIIACCLERDPGRRYQSVEELAAALAPLATMHERFRGRSTGAFSRHLIEKQMAQRNGRLPPPAPLPPGQAAVLALRGSIAWLRERPVRTYVAMALASVLAVLVGSGLVGDIRWMAPPPKGGAAVRAEPVLRSEPHRVPSADVPRIGPPTVLPLLPALSSEVVAEPAEAEAARSLLEKEAKTGPAHADGLSQGSHLPSPSAAASKASSQARDGDAARKGTPQQRRAPDARPAAASSAKGSAPKRGRANPTPEPTKKERAKPSRPSPAGRPSSP
jgi:serine/threonine protein kinase